jgi:hypothetical protein
LGDWRYRASDRQVGRGDRQVEPDHRVGVAARHHLDLVEYHRQGETVDHHRLDLGVCPRRVEAARCHLRHLADCRSRQYHLFPADRGAVDRNLRSVQATKDVPMAAEFRRKSGAVRADQPHSGDPQSPAE